MYIVVVVVFCVVFHVLFSDLEWIPTFQSRSPKALTRPAIVGIFVPSSWAGNHWVQVWNHWNFGRSNWGCNRAQKLRHPCTNWKKLWGRNYQTIPDYTRLPDLFEALKCRNKLNKFHCFLTYLNHMEKARQCSTPLLFCQRLPRHAWGWEETTTNRLQSCTPLLLVLSHRDVSWNELHHFGPVITEGWTATSLERGLYQANKVNLEIKWSLEVNQWKMMDHERWH